MQMHNNVDNNINYSLIDLKLRKINDTIYDSISKKADGYYCRIVCGYKPYDQNHTYGEENVIHNGLYMIYPLPQHEIKEYKLESFTPPKLLDGDSLITVDSFNSTNPSEFTIKVPIDRRYMATKEYVEGTRIFLEARDDRNHNKKIQIKEIWNDTSNALGETSLDNTNFIELNQYSYLETNIYKNTLVTGISSVSVKDNQIIVGKSWGKSYFNFDLSKFQLKKIKISCYVTRNVFVGWYFRPDKNGASSTIPAAEGALFESNWCPIGEKVKYEKILTIPENAKYIHIEGQDCIYEDICISILEGYKTPQIELPRPLQPNEIYSWDEYKKHYVVKKNVKEELYQNYTKKNVPNMYRYIREYLNGSNSNTGNHWVEIEVWSNGVNIAQHEGVKLTCSSDSAKKEDLKLLIDGNTKSDPYFSGGSGTQWVQLELAEDACIDEIKIWHFYTDSRKYKDVKLECSYDGIVWDTIYNNETPYQEKSSGKTYNIPEIIAAKGLHNNTFNVKNVDKILISKQLINDYSITFQNDSLIDVSTTKINMKEYKGINKNAYFNIVNVPENSNNIIFNIDKSDLDQDFPIVYKNFDSIQVFNGRIDDTGALISDETSRTYYLKVRTDAMFDLFIKGGDVLRLGYVNDLSEICHGSSVAGVKDYDITSEGTYLHINMQDFCSIKNTSRFFLINTNSEGTANANPCTDLFAMLNAINLHQNYLYDEVEYCKDCNKIIEFDFAKIKDYEEPYADAITINDWKINEDSIEKTEDRQAYSALILCNSKDSLKISGESLEQFKYAYLDSNMELIPNTIKEQVLAEENITDDVPDNAQYCLLNLSTSGLLNQEDINIVVQSFIKSSEIDNYISIEGNPVISLSVPYKKIRPLPAPTNIKVVDKFSSLEITWDTILGAEEYIVYLEDQILETVDTNKLVLFKELKGHVTIRAVNDLTQSELSESVYVHSVPQNPFIMYIDNTYENNQYKFDVTFKDDSEIETSYKLNYIVDDRSEETIELPGTEGVGEISKGTFYITAIDERVRVRVLAVNEQGENEIAPVIELKMPPEVTWAYKDDTEQLVVSWLNTISDSEMYVVRYKEEGAEHVSTQNILNEYSPGSRITTYIPLGKDKRMQISIAAIVKEDIPHIFSKPIWCSAAQDVNLTAPTDFKSRKLQANQIEFSWLDTHEVEEGWELAIVLNNTKSETIFIPSTTSHSIGTRQTYVYTFPEYGFMDAKLRMKWMLGASKYTDTITNYYFEIDNRPPGNVSRTYVDTNSIKFTWEAQGFVNRYAFNIKKATDDQFTTYYCSSPEFYFEDFEEVDYIYNIKTEFLGEEISEPTIDYLFKPTINRNKDLIVITNEDNTEHNFVERTYTSISDSYELATKSIKQGTEVDYPIYMSSTTEFTMSYGPIAIETWGINQRYEGNNSMAVITENVVTSNQFNTISYKEIEDIVPYKTTIITKSTDSYKIEMEVNKTRIVCIGDSITAGHPGFWAESMTGEITHQYPYWLDRRLKFQYEVINKGYGSDRTYNVLNRFQKDVLDLSPQYCLIQIGTNDIYWGAASAAGSTEVFESSTLADMKKNIVEMVRLCNESNIIPILGLLIPRTQVATDPVVKFGLYAFNDWLIEYANSTEGLNYVDFFNAGKDKIPPTPLEDPSSPGAMNPIYDGDNVYDEEGNLVKYGAGIHLNAEGYRIMAEAIPLNFFSTIESGVKMYMDEKCTVEATYNIEDKQNPFYEIQIEGMKLTRTKKIIRYIKNIGNSQVLFSLYPNDIYNLDYKFKLKEDDEGLKTVTGILTPGNSVAVIMELTPLVEDSKSSIELSLVAREFSIDS